MLPGAKRRITKAMARIATNLSGVNRADGTLDSYLARLGIPMLFARHEEIYDECDRADHLYQVARGTVRTCKLLGDGRRQVGSFYLRGDMFGFDAAGSRMFSAEAISNSTIIAVKRDVLMAHALQEQRLAKALWRSTVQELARTRRHALLLARTAQERLAVFLLEMAERQCGTGIVDLPMSRQDIADHLGLTIETISRSLTQLEENSLIELSSVRRILLKNASGLRKLYA